MTQPSTTGRACMLLSAATALALAASPPGFTGRSSVELLMDDCGGDSGGAELRTVVTRNERFDVIDRYGEPLRVVKQSAYRKHSGCSEGSEGKVEFSVSSHPRDGGKATPALHFSAEGEDPRILDQLNWVLLRVTRYGCCGAEDSHSYLDPATGNLVAVASTELLPLELINRAESGGKQASIWRYVFALGSTAAGFDHADASQRGVVAELRFAGPDRATQIYALELPASDDGEVPGPWSVSELRWSGGELEQSAMLWVDGGPPQASQIDGITLHLTLACQCEAEPIRLSIPVRADRLSTGKLRGSDVRLRLR